ncbi:MAG: hypothetical protein JWR49_1830 [Tardiphaga sp.]|nr:hypothetical protein [Tardiphaga sp.]
MTDETLTTSDIGWHGATSLPSAAAALVHSAIEEFAGGTKLIVTKGAMVEGQYFIRHALHDGQ